MYEWVDRVRRRLWGIVLVLSISGIVVFLTTWVLNDRGGEVLQDVSYTDVVDDSKVSMLANWAVRSGIVRPYLDGSFRPDEFINERQFMVMLYSYLGMGDVEYITTMLDESNIEVKNSSEVYGRLRTAGIFSEGTNYVDARNYDRTRKMTVGEVVSGMVKYFRNESELIGEYEMVLNELGYSKENADHSIRKIEVIEIMYELHSQGIRYNNEIVVNSPININSEYLLIDDANTYVMYDDESKFVLSISEMDNEYVIDVRNLGTTPYEYYGYSILGYGSDGVSPKYETENYVALGGNSKLSNRIPSDVEALVFVIGDQVLKLSGEQLSTISNGSGLTRGVYYKDSESGKFKEVDDEFMNTFLYENMIRSM